MPDVPLTDMVAFGTCDETTPSVEQAISDASKKVLEVVLARALILSNLKLGLRTFVILLPILSPRQSSALVAKSVITISFFLVSGWERFVGIPTAMRFRDRSMVSFGPLPNHVPGQEARTQLYSLRRPIPAPPPRCTTLIPSRPIPPPVRCPSQCR